MPAPKTLSERRRALSLIRIPMVVVLILAYLLSLLVAATVADEEELADEEKVAGGQQVTTVEWECVLCGCESAGKSSPTHLRNDGGTVSAV